MIVVSSKSGGSKERKEQMAACGFDRVGLVFRYKNYEDDGFRCKGGPAKKSKERKRRGGGGGKDTFN